MTRVIICHGRLGNAELAVKAFRYLEQKGGHLTPSLISCYATIEACTAAENEVMPLLLHVLISSRPLFLVFRDAATAAAPVSADHLR